MAWHTLHRDQTTDKASTTTLKTLKQDKHRDQTTDKASTTTLKTLKQKGSNRNTCKEMNSSKL